MSADKGMRKAYTSIRTERFHDVDACGAGGWQGRRYHCCEQEDGAGADDGNSAWHFRIAQITGSDAGEDEATDGSGHDADDGHGRAFFDDRREKLSTLGADGETDTKFAGATADGKGEDARDADNGDSESDTGEATENQSVEAVGR